MKKEKYYKRFVFRKLYKQWVNDILGGFETWVEAKRYVDIFHKKKGTILK